MAVMTTGYSVPYTSNQWLQLSREVIAKEKAIMKMHLLTTNVRNKIKPPLHDATPDQLAMARSIYGVRLRPIPKQMRIYDRINRLPPDWDQRVKKDSQRYTTQYQIQARLDDENRVIPVLTNCEFGHRWWARPEPFKRDKARVMEFHNSNYRSNGVNLGTNDIL